RGAGPGATAVHLRGAGGRLGDLFAALRGPADPASLRGSSRGNAGGGGGTARRSLGSLPLHCAAAGQAGTPHRDGARLRPYGGRIRGGADDWRKHPRQDPGAVSRRLRSRRSDRLRRCAPAGRRPGAVRPGRAARALSPEPAAGDRRGRSMIGATLRLERAGFRLAVDFAMPGAGITALFGPSGCGKTTVLRAVAGLERARGRVRLGDEHWQDDAQGVFVPTHRRSIGYVVQDSALFPHLSVRRNLEYGLRRRADRDGGERVDLAALVDLLGIGHLLERRPATLSGGERQRVAIARALA